MRLAIFMVVTWSLVGCIAAILLSRANLRRARSSLLSVVPRREHAPALPRERAAPAQLTGR
jgi:hypothetical protein